MLCSCVPPGGARRNPIGGFDNRVVTPSVLALFESSHERTTPCDPIRSGRSRRGAKCREPTPWERAHAPDPKHRRAEHESGGPRWAALHFLSIAWQARAACINGSSASRSDPRATGDTRQHGSASAAGAVRRRASHPIFPRRAASNEARMTCERMRSQSAEHRLQDPHRRTGSAAKALENRCLKTWLQKRNGLSICSCHPYYGLIVCGGGC